MAVQEITCPSGAGRGGAAVVDAARAADMVIVFALLAALSNAVNEATQHIASTAAPRRSSGWRLVVYLFRNPLWLFGWVALAAAFVFQALALHNGLLSIVQPVLAVELVFMLLLRRLLDSPVDPPGRLGLRHRDLRGPDRVRHCGAAWRRPAYACQ